MILFVTLFTVLGVVVLYPFLLWFHRGSRERSAWHEQHRHLKGGR